MAKRERRNGRKKYFPGISLAKHNILWVEKVLRKIKIRYKAALIKFGKDRLY